VAHRTVTRPGLALGAALLLFAGSSGAQEYQGLNGSLSVGHASWTFQDTTQSALSAGLTAGYRMRIHGLGRYTTITPHVALTFTEVAGMSWRSRSTAFSRVEAGLQLAAPVWHDARLYALARTGKGTFEKMSAGQPANYFGGGRALGVGVEVPVLGRCDNAVELSVVRATGETSVVEVADVKPDAPYVRSYSSTIIALAWSGRFRGTRRLFSTHCE
jgi:hypothetical protein